MHVPNSHVYHSYRITEMPFLALSRPPGFNSHHHKHAQIPPQLLSATSFADTGSQKIPQEEEEEEEEELYMLQPAKPSLIASVSCCYGWQLQRLAVHMAYNPAV